MKLVCAESGAGANLPWVCSTASSPCRHVDARHRLPTCRSTCPNVAWYLFWGKRRIAVWLHASAGRKNALSGPKRESHFPCSFNAARTEARLGVRFCFCPGGS